MKIFRSLFFALLVAFAVVGMYGCPQNDSNDGPAEQAGEQIDNAVDSAGDAIEDASDKAGDAIEDAGDKAEDAVN